MTKADLCPCGTERPYAQCCEPYIKGKSQAPTAEAMMRSRYTAYVKGEISYIQHTLDPSQQAEFDEASVKKWSQESEWLGLKVLKTDKGGAGDDVGTVEFLANYSMEGKAVGHHEIAEFRRKDGRWFFFDSKFPKAETIRREEPKTGRNDPCVCGSGKKFKKCCG